MKRLLIFLLILLSVSAFAASKRDGVELTQSDNADGVTIGKVDGVTFDSGGTSYLLEESFSGTTAPAGWTYDGTYVDWSTDGQVEIDYNATAYCISPTFTALSTSYIAVTFNFPSFGQVGDVYFFDLRSGSTTIATLKVRSTNNIRLGHSGINTSGDVISDATDYYFWFVYVAGSGTDGQIDLYYNTSGDFSTATHDIDVNDGTFTESIDNIRFRHSSVDMGSNIQAKHVIVSSSAIGDFTDE